METVLGVVTNLFTVTGDVVTTALANPVMMIGVAATVGGIGISWFKRLTGQGGRKRR